LVEARDLCPVYSFQIGLEAHLTSCPVGRVGFIIGDVEPERETAYHATPLNNEVKIGGAIPPVLQRTST